MLVVNNYVATPHGYIFGAHMNKRTLLNNVL